MGILCAGLQIQKQRLGVEEGLSKMPKVISEWGTELWIWMKGDSRAHTQQGQLWTSHHRELQECPHSLGAKSYFYGLLDSSSYEK